MHLQLSDFVFLAGFVVAYYFEARGNPNFNKYGVAQTAVEIKGSEQSGGNMEGKEVRFGIANSALFATITTDASCGAINAQHAAILQANTRGRHSRHLSNRFFERQ